MPAADFPRRSCLALPFLLGGLFLMGTTNGKAAPAAHEGAFAPKSYAVYYGSWKGREIDAASDFELVVLHPGKDLDNITKDKVRALKKRGVKVIAYISIGEAEDLPRGPEQDGGEGPVYFDKDKGIVKTGNGYPSYFLDHRAYRRDDSGFFKWKEDGMPDIVPGHDGVPDENGRWGSYFVHAGDKAWQDLVISRMRVMVWDLEPDGFFLDTLDTASPWGDYGWMQEDMARFVRRIGDEFPDHYILANRGLFLFEKYGDIVRPAIDGLMFESFVSEWDWYRKKGFPHRWLGSNIQVLEQHVLPHASRPDGFHLFLLNYLDPKQPDFYNMLADLHQAMGRARWTGYVSTPDLQSLKPAPESYYWKDENLVLPRITEFKAEDSGSGGFRVIVEVESDRRMLKLGEHIFLDVRYAAGGGSAEDLLGAERVEIDYDLIESEKTGGGRRYVFESYGLHDFKEYRFFARLLGKRPGLISAVAHAKLVTSGSGIPDIVTGLRAESREQAVLLGWKSVRDEGRGFSVYMGAHPWRLKKVREAKGEGVLIDGLRNNDVYYFTVAAVDAKGREGRKAFPIVGVPRKSAQPLPPGPVRVESAAPGALKLSWEKSKDEQVSGYRVYCFRKDKGLRLPIKTDPTTTSCTLRGLKSGKTYVVFVTTVDFDGIQSHPTEKLEIPIP